ncbi:hypothetical protein X975_19523, partial [Stegodyphus mimosarum]
MFSVHSCVDVSQDMSTLSFITSVRVAGDVLPVHQSTALFTASVLLKKNKNIANAKAITSDPDVK